MRARLTTLGLVGLLLIAACAEDVVPTAPTGQTAANAPALAGLDVQPATNGLMTLRVRATDPNGATLTYAWSKEAGDLSTTVGPSTLWRPPTTAGTYAVTVTVTNSRGVSTAATQRFQVAGDGQATQAGGATITPSTDSGATSGTGKFGTGQFQVPTPVPFATPSLFVIGGNPNAATPVPPTPSPPFTQPVATPGAPTPTPTAGPGQPIATPTPTPPVQTPTPMPTPTPKPATPEPGVPVPPTSIWRKYDSGLVPTSVAINAVHFTSPNRGWAVGSYGTVLLYNRASGVSNPMTTPWVMRNGGVSNLANLQRVFFVSDTVGFAAGGGGTVLRTVDGGLNWQNIAPPLYQGVVTALVVVNAQIVEIGDNGGQVFRSENANAANPANVSWNKILTRPADRTVDWSYQIQAGANFPAASSTVSWYVGDGIFRKDAAANGTESWRKVVNLTPAEGTATAIHMTSANEIWVGLGTGGILKSSDGGVNWARYSRYFNREHNGNDQYFTISAIHDIHMVDGNNIYVSGGASGVYDTKDAGNTWKETPVANLSDIQIEQQVVGNSRQFFGWGVGNGGIWFLVPEVQ